MFDEILETAEEFTGKALSIMLLFIFWGFVVAIAFHALASMFDSVVDLIRNAPIGGML